MARHTYMRRDGNTDTMTERQEFKVLKSFGAFQFMRVGRYSIALCRDEDGYIDVAASDYYDGHALDTEEQIDIDSEFWESHSDDRRSQLIVASTWLEACNHPMRKEIDEDISRELDWLAEGDDARRDCGIV